jgi:hypothetical protein
MLGRGDTYAVYVEIEGGDIAGAYTSFSCTVRVLGSYRCFFKQHCN